MAKSEVTTHTSNDSESLRTRISELEQDRATLHAVQIINERLSSYLEVRPLIDEMARVIVEVTQCERCIVLQADVENATLEFGACSPPLPDSDARVQLELIFISVFNAPEESMTQRLAHGEIISMARPAIEGTRFEMLATMEGLHHLTFVPLTINQQLHAVLITSSPGEISEQQRAILMRASMGAARALDHARKHSRIVEQLESTLEEMNILQRIDEELNDMIELNYVFRMIMDWALRFTNADAAGLALYDGETDSLSMMAEYGYREGAVQLGETVDMDQPSITHRVARSGKSEIIPDVSLDKDYHSVADNIRAQMSVPILREDRVIAVISLESEKLNGFTEDHLSFVNKLAQRAGVAVDNARLFTETNREREKLQHILRNIADIVIVVGPDQRIVLFNDSAVMALRLQIGIDYQGQRLNDVIDNEALLQFYQMALEIREGRSDELELPNGRTYHARTDYHQGIGWIITMQDVTPYKETDKLKNELVATVSHDLKQPLSVMRGYLDLLQMTNQFDEKSTRYMANLNLAFYNMRQLIDDLLDLARIESGLELELDTVNLRALLNDCIEPFRQQAINKQLTLTLEVGEQPTIINGDPHRLRQIFVNLVSNAIKYTPPGGHVKVFSELKQDHVRISVQDDGLGISSEDQAQVFERFYRVRRPETDSIDGTGLGLAIVKSLVEAHNGKIDLKSQLGKGATFRVSLPT